MPALFLIRNDTEFRQRVEDWISLTVERDVPLIPTKKISPATTLQVLSAIATVDDPEIPRIAKVLRYSSVQVRGVIEALKTLFVIHEVLPHRMGTGKPRYYLCDPALASVLGANFERLIETTFYLEFFSKQVAHNLPLTSQLSYFRSPKGGIIHGVFETQNEISALKILPTERIDDRELLILIAFKNRMDNKKPVNLFALGGAHQDRKDLGLLVLPWESLA